MVLKDHVKKGICRTLVFSTGPDRTLDPTRISTNISKRSVPEQKGTSSASLLNSRKKR